MIIIQVAAPRMCLSSVVAVLVNNSHASNWLSNLVFHLCIGPARGAQATFNILLSISIMLVFGEARLGARSGHGQGDKEKYFAKLHLDLL